MRFWVETALCAAIVAAAIAGVAMDRAQEPALLHEVPSRPGTMTDAQGRPFALLFEVWPVKGDDFCRVSVELATGKVTTRCGAR